VKKCASCSKDLPDAALHCVFCGAKQPPAPATTGGLAKTVMGSYSANDVIEQLRNQQAAGGAPRPAGPTPGPSYGAPAPAPSPSPYQRPAPAPAPPPFGGPAGPGPMHPSAGPTLPGPPNLGPIPGGGSNPGAPPQPHGVPAVSSAAPTLFVAPGGGPVQPQGGFAGNIPGARPMPQQPFSSPPSAYNAGPGPGPGAQPFGGPGPAVPIPAPLPMPQHPPPYLASQATARSGRPIEPWKDSLRLMMFLWGGVLLVVFAMPLRIGDSMWFNWDLIIESAGKAKLPPLIVAAVGLLSIVLALIPTSPAPRGLIAGLLGLVGFVLPFVLAEVTEWKVIAPFAGTLLLIPGLFIREEYRESILPRILVTLGVIAILLPVLLPENSTLPLVSLFKFVIDAPGKAKVMPLLHIGYIVLVVLTLLAWLPAPASGGAAVFAWLLLIWRGIEHLVELVLTDKIVDVATTAPNSLISWADTTAYLVLIGYGFATVIGKKLE
jgi:hypothetical protein